MEATKTETKVSAILQVPMSWEIVIKRKTMPVGYESFDSETIDYDPLTQISYEDSGSPTYTNKDRSMCEKSSFTTLLGSDMDKDVQKDDW